MRLHLVVEGQTEETFVRNVITPHLGKHGVSAVPRLVATSRSRGRISRGGVSKYLPIRRDLQCWMREDKSADVRFSTMLDLYALPSDFPGFDAAFVENDPYKRVGILEQAFFGNISDYRFLPYIQLHEFEALLFSDVPKFDWEFIEHDKAIHRLATVAESFETPEHIDDGPTTAPSKRIIGEIPEYEGRKTSAGPLIAEKIGLDIIRSRCLHFGEWLSKLETLVG